MCILLCLPKPVYFWYLFVYLLDVSFYFAFTKIQSLFDIPLFWKQFLFSQIELPKYTSTHPNENKWRRPICSFVKVIWASTPLNPAVLESLRTAKAQTSLRIRADWSAHLLCNELNGEYQFKTCYKRNFTILASLCSWEDCFESRAAGKPEDRFCRVVAHLRLLSEIYA